MSTEKIKISLIHICNRTIHKGIIVLDKDNPRCSLLFSSSISQDIEIEGHDYFKCLIDLRIELEKQNYYLLCNGARRDVNCSGMSREASSGLYGHIMRLGKYIDLDDEVYIFDYAEPDLVVSVSEQEEFNELHRSSLPAVISYYAESTVFGAELISSQAKENIINQLSSHSDWQLLQREGDRLSFKFLDTPEQPQWNIEIIIKNDSIDILFTVENDINQDAFLTFLNEQLSLNGVICDLKKT
ncbi:hypothetical protein [Crocosphaera sp. Alani8]|uniref:hypothetical protein n=1 Tax=Crocosphaera sp. Alani8 TaxID=3038952 RepID=UPI00313D4266